jgi:hypothetical protein
VRDNLKKESKDTSSGTIKGSISSVISLPGCNILRRHTNKMPDIIRDSTFGQFVRSVSKNKVLKYEDEKPGFELPAAIRNGTNQVSGDSKTEGTVEGNAYTLGDGKKQEPSNSSSSGNGNELSGDNESTVSRNSGRSIHLDGIELVDWYSSGTYPAFRHVESC